MEKVKKETKYLQIAERNTPLDIRQATCTSLEQHEPLTLMRGNASEASEDCTEDILSNADAALQNDET